MVSLINNFCLLQKRLKRQKALVQSTSIPNEEKRRFKDCMNVEYMSSEHSVSEDNADEENSSEDENVPKKKVLCRRPLPWRSQELNNFFVKLDWMPLNLLCRKEMKVIPKLLNNSHVIYDRSYLPIRVALQI